MLCSPGHLVKVVAVPVQERCRPRVSPRGLAPLVRQLMSAVLAQPLLLLWRWLLLFCRVETVVMAAVTPDTGPTALPCV